MKVLSEKSVQEVSGACLFMPSFFPAVPYHGGFWGWGC